MSIGEVVGEGRDEGGGFCGCVRASSLYMCTEDVCQLGRFLSLITEPPNHSLNVEASYLHFSQTLDFCI